MDLAGGRSGSEALLARRRPVRGRPAPRRRRGRRRRRAGACAGRGHGLIRGEPAGRRPGRDDQDVGRLLGHAAAAGHRLGRARRRRARGGGAGHGRPERRCGHARAARPPRRPHRGSARGLCRPAVAPAGPERPPAGAVERRPTCVGRASGSPARARRGGVRCTGNRAELAGALGRAAPARGRPRCGAVCSTGSGPRPSAAAGGAVARGERGSRAGVGPRAAAARRGTPLFGDTACARCRAGVADVQAPPRASLSRRVAPAGDADTPGGAYRNSAHADRAAGDTALGSPARGSTVASAAARAARRPRCVGAGDGARRRGGEGAQDGRPYNPGP